jgi:2-oxoglutarate dehydrogenase E1 component
MYEAWKKDRSSVHSSWAAYFSAVEAGLPPHLAHNVPHNLGFDHNVKVPLSALSSSSFSSIPRSVSADVAPSTVSAVAIKDSIRMFNLARAFQRNGHHMATLDPLNRSKEEKIQPKFVPRDLDPEYWGFREEDLDRPVFIEGNPPVLSLEGRTYVTTREAVSELRRVYCGNIGVEFTHLKVLSLFSIFFAVFFKFHFLF